MKKIKLYTHPASYLFIAVIFILYFVPLLVWSTAVFTSKSINIPQQLSLYPIFIRTINFSIAVSVLSILIAYPYAIIWRLSCLRIQKTIVYFMLIPLIMGLLARNYSWIGILSGHNMKDVLSIGFSSFLYTRPAVLVIMTCIFCPISFFVLIQGAASIHKDQIDAGRVLGLPDWKIIFQIFLPLTRRAATLAFLMNFALAVGFFVTPKMIGGGKFDFIGNVILDYINLGSFDIASTLALMFLATTVIPIIIIISYSLRRRILMAGR